MHSGLDRKVVWITGASGGIGWALAECFAAEGARLVLHGHGHFEDLARRVRAAGWTERALCVRFDVTDRAAQFEAADRARAHFGRLDACVANAGIWPEGDVPLHEQSEERVRSAVEVNLLGAVWTAQAFLAQLARTGPREDGDGAALVFIGSTAGRFGERHHAEYSLTKAAMYGLVRTLKNEIVGVDPFGRVNLVEPGWTATEMAREALADDALVRRVVQTMPLAQIARAQDVAHAVTFLCSPRLARHVSGEVLTVAGGMEGRVQRRPEDADLRALRARLED